MNELQTPYNDCKHATISPYYKILPTARSATAITLPKAGINY